MDCNPLVGALVFLYGEYSAALTLKVVYYCFFEVFLDLLPLSLEVSIMVIFSSFYRIVGTVCGGLVPTWFS